MNLVIDSGNTLTKVAVFKGEQIMNVFSREIFSWEIISELIEKNNCTHSIVCDVSGRTGRYLDHLKNSLHTLIMGHQLSTPIKNCYKSMETLGADRLAAAVYGASVFPGKNVLTIQTGTCITYEMVNQEGEYLGGAISPGIEMRLKALHTFTSKLPLVKKNESSQLTGTTTADSILSGIINGCRAETDGMIDQYKEIFPDLMVVLGGGDIFFFDKRLKNRIFAVENLVLKGLNLILEHNI